MIAALKKKASFIIQNIEPLIFDETVPYDTEKTFTSEVTWNVTVERLE